MVHVSNSTATQHGRRTAPVPAEGALHGACLSTNQTRCGAPWPDPTHHDKVLRPSPPIDQDCQVGAHVLCTPATAARPQHVPAGRAGLQGPTTHRAHLYNCHSQPLEASSSHPTAPAVGHALLIASSSCAGNMPQAWVRRRHMARRSPLISPAAAVVKPAKRVDTPANTPALLRLAPLLRAAAAAAALGALATGTGSCHFTGPCLPCPPWSCWAPGCSASLRCVQGLSPGA